MRRVWALAAVTLIWHSAGAAHAPDQPIVLTRVTPLSKALDPAFEFRKTKLFLMTEEAPQTKQSSKGKARSGDFTSSKAPNTTQAAAITFERQYRLFGAVTKLDQHQRFGNYFDFFWRTKKPA